MPSLPFCGVWCFSSPTRIGLFSLALLGPAGLLRAGATVTADQSLLGQAAAAALEAQPELSAETKLEVKASGGIVHLGGSAANLYERELAARVVEGIDGVALVKPAIAIPKASSDEDLVAAVQVAARQAAGNEVQASVSSGKVLLEGSVARARDAWLAAEAVQKVPGVHEVESKLGVQAPGRSDEDVRSQAIAALVAAGLKGLEVSVQGGVVTLGGRVERLGDASLARKTVVALPSVSGVRDELRVFVSKEPLYSKARPSDADIERSVIRAIEREGISTAEAHVVVRSFDGTVSLEGEVPTEAAALKAVQAAASVAGVTGIVNSLSVRQQRRP